MFVKKRLAMLKTDMIVKVRKYCLIPMKLVLHKLKAKPIKSVNIVNVYESAVLLR